MAQAIFEAARDLDVARVLVEVMQEQTGGIAIFERLGFCVEGTFSDHARDRFGSRHHLHILAYHNNTRSMPSGPCRAGRALAPVRSRSRMRCIPCVAGCAARR